MVYNFLNLISRVILYRVSQERSLGPYFLCNLFILDNLFNIVSSIIFYRVAEKISFCSDFFVLSHSDLPLEIEHPR